MEYYSCKFVAGMYLVLNSRIDMDWPHVTLCCESMPGVALLDEPDVTMARYLILRSQLIAEGFVGGANTRNEVFCRRCMYYKKAKWEISPLVSYVNISAYPSPCQCRCIYCYNQGTSLMATKTEMRKPDVKTAYERLYKLIRYGQDKGFILPDATYQISCGEITIHEYKNQIMELVRGRKTRYLTNAFLYDEDLGREMHRNPDAEINLSIDAGTPQTWSKIKGVNNFEKVMSNLVRYYKDSTREGQISFKYIVMPGINDNIEDYVSLMEIMNVLGIKELTIARDGRIKYRMNDGQRVQLFGATAYLMAVCRKTGVKYETSLFADDEKAEAELLADEILQKGLI